MPRLSIPAALAVAEGQPLAVPITKEGEGACRAVFRTRAASATRDVDYVGTETTVTFGPADTRRTVTVLARTDAVADPGESFEILLEKPDGCTLGNATGRVTITEVPRIDLGPDIEVAEGSAAVFTLTKSGPGACSVKVRTRAGTAAVDRDYAGTVPTTIAFADADRTKTFTVPVPADVITEGAETFVLRVDPGSEWGCRVERAEATATIRDVSPKPPPPPADPEPPPIPEPQEPVTPPSDGDGEPDDETPDEEPDMPPAPTSPLPAPKGFGNTRGGGLGRPVYRVTSLADTNTPGTLRHGLLTAGTKGRLIVFEVAGVIRLTARLNVLRAYNVTVAGETAPPPGIVLQASGKFNGPLLVLFDCRNFHLSNIPFEQIDHDWKVSDTNYDGFGTEPRAGERCEDVWIDHCATFWTQDEAASIYHGSTFDPKTSALRNISITNTMFCEPLWKSELAGSQPHWEGGKVDEPEHNFNLLIGRQARNVDVQYCLFQDATWRNPWVDVATTAVLANNVANNCQHAATVQMNNNEGSTLLTVAGYLVITGPNTHNTALSGLRIHNVRTGSGRAHRFYAEGLYGWKGNGAKVAPTDRVFLRDEAAMRPFMASRRPIDCPVPVKALPPQELYDRVLRNVGPRPRERLIPSVARAVDKLRRKTGRYVHLPSDSGGPTVLKAVQRPLGPEGGSTSPGRFADGTPIPPMPRASDAAAMGRWLQAFRRSVQFD